MTVRTTDGIDLRVKLLLAILGAILAVIGWYRLLG